MRNGQEVNGAVLDLPAQDPVWAAYVIADLRPDLAPLCSWLVAPDASGLALLFTGPAAPILLTAGTPEGVEAALTDTDLSKEVFLSVLPSHLPAVKRHYPHIVPQEMLRMMLIPSSFARAPDQPAARLAGTDELRLAKLYQHGGEHAPDSFEPSQLEDGYFNGIEDEDVTLVAAGGTRVTFRSDFPPQPGKKPHHAEVWSAVERIVAYGGAAIGNT